MYKRQSNHTLSLRASVLEIVHDPALHLVLLCAPGPLVRAIQELTRGDYSHYIKSLLLYEAIMTEHDLFDHGWLLTDTNLLRLDLNMADHSLQDREFRWLIRAHVGHLILYCDGTAVSFRFQIDPVHTRRQLHRFPWNMLQQSGAHLQWPRLTCLRRVFPPRIADECR